MEDITDSDHIPAKRICKDLEIKNVGQNHDFYIKDDSILLADIFQNF